MQVFQDVTEVVDDLDLLAAIQRQQWPWRGECLMAAFDLGVCTDESGIHDDAPLCILAGYIASVNQWIRFDERWQAVLQRYDVLDFHSKEFFSEDDQSGRSSGDHVTKHWTISL